LLHVKSKSTALIAHQFGTPISAIRLKSYLLRTHLGSLSKERITEHLEQIEAQLDQMVDLLDDLVLVNQVYSSEPMTALSPLDLEAFSKKILDPMALDWSEREITFAFSGSLNNVQLDRRLVRYVLANLVGGVLKYSGSSVHLDIRRADSSVTFTVIARDVVISAHQLEKILVQLSHGDGSGTLNGTGLSLSVMKTCVELYGGTITVESKPGKGTSFIVSLPCRSA
jgi:signal transduction histidine kinase